MAPPLVRDSIMSIEPYRPGLTVAEVKAAHLGLRRVVKLGSNELGLPPLEAAREAAAAAARSGNRYPDPWCTELREALAEVHGVMPEQVVPGNGADELIRLTCLAVLDRETACLYPWPGFPTHAQGALAVGAETRPVSMPPGRLDLDLLLERVDDAARLVCVANPNNPTGAAASQAEVRSFLERLPAGTLCLLDEAYHGFEAPETGTDGASLVAEGYENVCAVRTFSKAYGLAGFRVGYAVAPPALADALNRVRTMFNVNQPGQAAALASLAFRDEIEQRCESVRRRRHGLSTELAGLGIEGPPSQGNFLFLPCEGDPWSDGPWLADELLMRGIIVRTMEGFGAPGAIRVTVGAPAEIEALTGALAEIAAKRVSGASP